MRVILELKDVPKNCVGCAISSQGRFNLWYCGDGDKIIETPYAGRAPFCPLKIEGKEHGAKNKWSSELLSLVQANPGLPIEFLVNNEVCKSDDRSWWKGDLTKVSVEEVCCRGEHDVEHEYGDDDRYYIKSQDEDDLVERIAEYDIEDTDNSDEAWKKAEDIFEKLPWRKIILCLIDD